LPDVCLEACPTGHGISDWIRKRLLTHLSRYRADTCTTLGRIDLKWLSMNWAGPKFGVQRSLQMYGAGRDIAAQDKLRMLSYLKEARRGKVWSAWWPGS
jgi:hypothetical protein